MPYEGEFASKTSHVDFLNNPDIKRMLEECTYLKPPSDEEAQALADQFIDPPTSEDELPQFVISVDGSNHEVSIDDKLPSSKFGFIKLGVVLIDLREFGDLKVGNFVDPFRVAELKNKNTSLTFFLPSANITWKDQFSVRDSFRALLDQQLSDERTRFRKNDPQTSLRSTLFALASLRPGVLGTESEDQLNIYQCPSCEHKNIPLLDIPDQQFCPECKAKVYPSDCLRLWEEVSDFQSNQSALTRLMMVLEHLIPAHYIRMFLKESPILLRNLAFFVDGPLAIFGNPAWLHRSMMIFLDNAKKKLARFNIRPILMIGLQKTGQVVDYLNFVDRFLPNNKIYPLDDDFRYKYILGNRDPAAITFGFETYYGQDFIFKTASGKTFNFLIPYPYNKKDIDNGNFNQEKVNLDNYENLPLAIALIQHLESDLYKNAIVPVALAHSYTAISFEPGGKVLDLFTRKNVGGQNNG